MPKLRTAALAVFATVVASSIIGLSCYFDSNESQPPSSAYQYAGVKPTNPPATPATSVTPSPEPTNTIEAKVKEVTVSVTDLNKRDYPSTSGGITGKLSVGENVGVDGYFDNGSIRWLHAHYLIDYWFAGKEGNRTYVTGIDWAGDLPIRVPDSASASEKASAPAQGNTGIGKSSQAINVPNGFGIQHLASSGGTFFTYCGSHMTVESFVQKYNPSIALNSSFFNGTFVRGLSKDSLDSKLTLDLSDAAHTFTAVMFVTQDIRSMLPDGATVFYNRQIDNGQRITAVRLDGSLFNQEMVSKLDPYITHAFSGYPDPLIAPSEPLSSYLSGSETRTLFGWQDIAKGGKVTDRRYVFAIMGSRTYQGALSWARDQNLDFAVLLDGGGSSQAYASGEGVHRISTEKRPVPGYIGIIP